MTINTGEEIISKPTETPSWEIKKYAHIISPPENVAIFAYLVQHGNEDPSAQDIVAAAKEHGWWVKAICSTTFVPVDDPEAYDACQICMDVAGMHMRNAGE